MSALAATAVGTAVAMAAATVAVPGLAELVQAVPEAVVPEAAEPELAELAVAVPEVAVLELAAVVQVPEPEATVLERGVVALLAQAVPVLQA